MRLPFIPARNSRHRAAALALYRSLLRFTNRLPADVHDAAHVLLRRQMDKHRTYISPRLIYSSMATGYKCLSLADDSRDEITRHLRSYRPRPPSLSQRRTPSEPLLVNTAPKGHLPQYTSRKLPRPRSDVGKTRLVPRLCATADGQPFLRMRKPQSPQLSRMVGRKGRVFTSKIYRLVAIDEELAREANLEDEWEAVVASQMAREGLEPDRRATYRWSTQLSRLWWEWQIERTWLDWVARGEALNGLVQKEMELSLQERGVTPQKQKKPGVKFRPNVAVHPAPPLPLTAAIRAKLKEVVYDTNDPFTSKTWQVLVETQTPRLMKWINKESG